MLTKVYLGLGSNLGDKAANLEKALARLAVAGVNLQQQSSIYATAPVGYVEQDDFYNMVVAGTTELNPRELLVAINQIELELGRTREIHWGPRTIDIDILLYGTEIIKQDNLIIPHGEMAKRAFVLVPLAEIAPDIIIPGLGEVKTLLAALAEAEVMAVARGKLPQVKSSRESSKEKGVI